MRKTATVTLLVIVSTIIIFSFRLGLIFPTQITTQMLGPFYIAYFELPESIIQKQGTGEHEIMEITRELYNANILHDGHKAQAMLWVHQTGNRNAGLILSQDLYEKSLQLKKNGSLFKTKFTIIPKQKMMHASIPRINILSLYVGQYKTLAAMRDQPEIKKHKDIQYLEIYSKRIRYMILLGNN